MHMMGQDAIPSTTIIGTVVQNCCIPQFSSSIPFSYIFHEIFISSSRELFPVFIYSANLNGAEDFADSEQDLQPCFIRWKLHVDEKAVQGRSRHSTFKCGQMTAHLLLATHCRLNPILLLSYWCLTQITAVLYCGIWAWMTPQGNRFTSCCCGRSI